VSEGGSEGVSEGVRKRVRAAECCVDSEGVGGVGGYIITLHNL